MGLAAIYPKPKPTGLENRRRPIPISEGIKHHQTEPSWATDITYIRLTMGLFIWSQLWIGFPGMCCLGNFQTHSMYTFVYRRLIGHLANRDR